MKTNTITIAGKEVTLAYCYATEIGFKKLTGKNVDEFEAGNPEHVAYMIIAAILAYYQSKGEEPPVGDDDIIYRATPKELVDAVTEVYKMRAEWYELPVGEPEDKPTEDDPKND